MKYLVLFLATAAIASASLIGSKKVHITEDGTIVIQGEDGKQVQIKKDGLYGQKNIEIDITGPNTPAKRIKIDNNNLVNIERGVEYTIPTTDDDSSYLKNKRSYTKEEFLNELLKSHLGYDDVHSFETLFEKVQKAVLNGEVDAKVLDYLKGLKWDTTKVSGQDYHGKDMTTLNKQYKYTSEMYGQDGEEYFYDILMKMFDQEVLKMILKHQNYEQDYYSQKSSDALWDAVFSHQEVFDYKLLIKVINDKVLRNQFVSQGFFDKVVLEQIIYAYKTEGTYDQYLLQRLVNIQELKQFFINHRISAYDVLRKTYNGQYDGQDYNQYYGQDFNQYNVKYFYNVLMKIFDRQVLKTVLVQQNMYNQEMYEQYSYEKTWSTIFAHQGIFDHQYLVEIISNKVWRNYFVQQGFFNNDILHKIMESYKTKEVYDQDLLQHLVNTEILKYFFINHRISVYDILNQPPYNNYYDKTTYNKYFGNTFFNKYYGKNFFSKYNSNPLSNSEAYGYHMLEKIISQPMCRNILVQYGIFNKNILEQILYHYKTQGVYDMLLLKQLVNKDALYRWLVQFGVVDQAVLRQYVENEYLGLNYLYRNNFFLQTPRLTYENNYYGNTPKYSQNTEVYPYGGNYFRNLMYGPKYYNLNKESYGKFYNQYPSTVQQTYWN